MKRKICYLLLAVTLLACILGCALTASAAGEGTTFTKTETYIASGQVTTEPNTLSATIHLPSTTADTTRAGVVLSNYSGAAGRSYSLEIHQYGRPRLFLQTSNSTAADIIFTTLDVRSDEPVRVSVVMDKANGNATCYISDLEGNLIAKETKAPAKPFPTAFTVDKEYMVGGDYRDGNAMAFIGTIYDVAMYADMRTEAECLAAATDPSDADMILGFDMTAVYPLCLNDLSGNGHHLISSEKSQGMEFDANVRQITNKLEALPKTIETWVYVPNVNRPGVMLGNYKNAYCFNFEIGAGGNPKLYFRDASGNIQNLVFKDENGTALVIQDEAWMHLAVVINDDSVLLYKNGEVVSTMPYTSGFSNEPLTLNFALGGDLRDGNVQYFKGRMLNLAAYTDARTAEEIKADMQAVSASADNLLLYYDLSEYTVEDTVISDLGPNGYHIAPPEAVWLEANPNAPTDYAYSMAVVGDTQCLTKYDATNGTSYTADIYDWLVANVESKNIQLVMGLGDITNDNTDAEWIIGKENITKLDGVVPYTLNRGNPPHDSVGKFNEYFADYAPYTGQLDGTLTLGAYENAYKKITVGETKYLVMMLDWGPTDDVLRWAGDVIASHPDHRVIITTHAYLYRDGTTLDAGDTAPAHKEGVVNGRNNGDEIWEELVKLYPNIVLVLSGHDPSDDIVAVQTDGIYGNTVTQMLIDPQGMDAANGYRTGMVAMLYFSADGNEISVEYVSTVRANAGEPAYYRAANQFDLTLLDGNDYSHADYAGTEVITKYGVIDAEYADAAEWPFVLFTPDESSASGYSFYGAYKALLSDDSVGVETTSTAMHAARIAKTAGSVILMRRDTVFAGSTVYSNLSYNPESVTVDLGGFTMTDKHTYSGGLFAWYAKESAKDKTFLLTVRNGSIILSDNPLLTHASSQTAGTNTSMTTVFENIDVSFADGATADCIIDRLYLSKDCTPTLLSVQLKYCTVDYAGGPVGADLLADGSLSSNTTLSHTGTAFLNRKNVLPLMNLSLTDGFILNVFVPVVTTEEEDTVTAITLGGVCYALNEIVTVDEVQYYKVSISVSPEAMGEALSLSVDVNHVYTYYGGATASIALTSNLTVDVIDYLCNLTESENTELATLGKDILSYVRSAYAYVGEDTDTVTRIDGIIGTDYDESAPPADLTEMKVTDGLASARLELTGTPAFIFYPELDSEGNLLYSAETYSFALDGKYRLNAEVLTDGDGKTYFRIKTYAYAMVGTVEYMISGTDIHGYFNVKAYHAFATSTGDAKLVTLVERLWKYAESAAAYRESVK